MTEPMQEAALIPELLVADIAASLRLYRDNLGFEILYDRMEDGFAALRRGAAEIMLEVYDGSPGYWLTGPVEPPLGRGVNLMVTVEDVDALAARVEAAGIALFRPLAEARYRVGSRTLRVRQFLVQDPDGYLLRFSQRLAIEDDMSAWVTPRRA